MGLACRRWSPLARDANSTEARIRGKISSRKNGQLPFPLAGAAANQEATKNLPSGLGGLRRAAQSESQPLAAAILISMLHEPSKRLTQQDLFASDML